MASNKEYLEYILGQLSELEEITYSRYDYGTDLYCTGA